MIRMAKKWALALGLLALASNGIAQTLLTIAGGPPASPLGGTPSRVGPLSHVAVDAVGTIYFSDPGNNRVLKVTPGSNQLTVVAGTGIKGFAGDGALAVNANLDTPSGLAFDSAGNLFIADTSNRRVRKLTISTGVISTYAGNGNRGYSGNGGQATSASMMHPTGLAFDSAGNLYIADVAAHAVRKVATGGIITAFAGTAGQPGDSGDGAAATSAKLRAPAGLFVDGTGQVYIADSQNHRVRLVGTSGMIVTVAGTGVRGFDGDGGDAALAKLSYPAGIALDSANNLIIADTGNLRLRRIAPNLTISTYAGIGAKGTAGDGGAAASANLSYPLSVARDAAGNILVVDAVNQRIRRIDRNTDVITTLVSNQMSQIVGAPQAPTQLVAPAGIVLDGAGQIVVADAGAHAIFRVNPATGTVTHIAGNGAPDFAGDGGAAVSASLSQPMSVAIDAAGNIFVADTGNQRVRRIEAGTNIITTYAGIGVADFAGDGGPAANAKISYPTGLAIAPNGDLLIADSYNNRVRRVNAAGVITTFAGNGSPISSGDEGPATGAGMYLPTSIAFDLAGNLLITENRNYRLRSVSASTGVISTVAPVYFYYGADTPFVVSVAPDGIVYASFARLDRIIPYTLTQMGSSLTAEALAIPTGMAFAPDGTLFFAETGNRAIKKIEFSAPGAPTVYNGGYGDGFIRLDVYTNNTGGKPVLDYTATCGAVSVTVAATSTFMTIVVPGLTNGAAYTCTVKARNVKGTGPSSLPTEAITPKTRPGAPTSVTAVAGAGQATVSFQQPVSNGGAAITGYDVTAYQGSFYVTSKSTASSPVTVTGLNNGTAYTFVVVAYNSEGSSPQSAPSNAVTPVTTPGEPTGVFATPGNGTLSVSFSHNATGGSPILEFVATCGSQSQSGAASPITVTGLTNGTAYICTVRAVNAQGSSPASSPSFAATPRTVPGAPQAVTGVAGNRQITVSWDPPSSNGGAAITGYQILLNGLIVSASNPTSPYTVTPLDGATAYRVGVRAVNAAGAGPQGEVLTPITASIAPTPPTTITLTPGDTTMLVSFSGGNDGGSPILDHTASCQALPAPEVLSQTAVSSPISITGLTNGATYTCSVKARNANGTSAASVTQSAFLKANAAIQLSATPNPMWLGTNATITAQVTGNSPTGTVSLFRNGSFFCSGTLASGTVQCGATSFGAAGTYAITASYSGDAGHQTATATLAGGFVVLPADPAPDPFSFESQAGVMRGAKVVSNTITPTGIHSPATVTVSGSDEYSINCNAAFFRTGPQLQPGQSICVRQTTSLAANTATTTTLTIGGVSGTFTTTTGTTSGAVPFSKRFDFTGEGRADILLRNPNTGENYLYPMWGTSIFMGEGYIRTVPAPWDIAGTGDFNGDGKADILLRNSSTGENYIYFMNGTSITSEGYVRTVPLAWSVAGVADFDGDGKADILLRNTSTGENYLYPMDGLNIKGTEGYIRTIPAPWVIAGLADFDGDTMTDMLLRNTSTGENYLYPMSGTSIKPTEGYIRTVPLVWNVAGLGDLDGDGKADILLRNTSNGDNYLYPMDGTTIKPSEGYIRTVPLVWTVASIADFDGDGKVDLLFRNTSTGENYMYPMDGLNIKNTEGYVRTVPLVWSVVSK
jgi:sugar lactone lactonase YvrE